MIVIVGAGLAGLAAAHRLVQSNYLDFILVEAQDVVGGRVRSVQLADGVRLDLGAQWLHGHKHNPIYNWLQSLDCIERLEDDEVEFEGLFVTSDGERASSEVVSKTLEILLDTKNQLYRYGHLASDACRPIDMFRGSITEALADPQIFKASDREIVELVQNWFELYEAIDNSCERLDQLSIKAYSDWKDFDDGKMVRIKGGWQSIVDKLEADIGRRRILLNTKVESIHQQKDGKICVTIDGSSPISCDHVILTQSVGALKRIIRRGFFSPELDLERSSKIQKIGFGPVNKVFLQFAKPYLQDERGLKILHKSPQHQNDGLEFLKQDSTTRWTRGVLSFDLIDGAPNVLLVWVGGIEATMMEQVCDEDLKETLLKLLVDCLPKNPPPKLVSMFRSAWSSNQWVGGAYSYPSLESAGDDIKTMWGPVCDRDSIPRLLFAGEATAGDMYATGHGAIISGWREADRLLKILDVPEKA